MYCSEDFQNQAIACCFCSFPLPLLCASHLSKHPSNTEYFHHFPLPLYARDWIASEETRTKCKPWLFKLHSAHTELRKNLTKLTVFEDELEAARLQLISEVNIHCSRIKHSFDELREALTQEVLNGIHETAEHALIQGEFSADTMAGLIWTHDLMNPQRLQVVRLSVETFKEKIAEAIQYSFEVSAPTLSQYNQRSQSNAEEAERLLRLTIETHLKELEVLKQQLEAANSRLKTQSEAHIRELVDVKSKSEIYKKSLAELHRTEVGQITLQLKEAWTKLENVQTANVMQARQSEARISALSLEIEALKQRLEDCNRQLQLSAPPASSQGAVSDARISQLSQQSAPDSSLRYSVRSSFQIFIARTGFPIIAITVSMRTTVLELKGMIRQKAVIPEQTQSLNFCGKCLNDERTLADYDIQKDSTLRLFLK